MVSVCSGVEAATVAWHSLGWQPQWFSEIEKFPSAVLKHHYPAVPNHGDMTKFKEWNDDRPIDVLVGGTPCQSFSVAGLRKGLDDPRGNLMLTYLAIAERYAPRWIVWENVPGVLSSNRGRDFGTFLGALGQLGYGFAYRVLDAQYFGVAQRRKRVFVVGHLGDWRRAAAVLFERESLSGYPAPSRTAREEIAGTIAAGSFVGGMGGKPEGAAVNHLVKSKWPAEIASTLNAHFGEKQGLEDQHINSGAPLFVPANVGPLTAGMHKGPRGTEAIESNHIIAFPAEMSGTQSATTVNLSPALSVKHTTAVATHDVAGTMLSRASSGGFSNSIDHAAAGYMALQKSQVRRLTPIECERLQGFPDNYIGHQAER
jgi:DNA (cytosine-5)-methyltransferase 1